jgi:branched-chain amino acid transport system permease protein
VALTLQVILTGLAAGAVYGLIAIGYALIYRLTGVVHFAIGELVSLAVFASLFFAAGTGPVTRTNIGTGRLALSVVGGLAVAVASGVLVYLVAVRPFVRRATLLGWVGAIVAVAFAVRGFLAASFTRQSYVFPDPFRFDRLGSGGVISLGGGVTVQVRTFFVIGLGIVLAAAAAWVLRSTGFGKALQAISMDRSAATIVGLPVDLLLSAAFALSGALAAFAAIAQAPSAPVSADTGALLGLKGLVAALLAKFGEPWKAFVAGLGVGVLEAAVATVHLGGFRPGPAYRDIVPLALALVVIGLRFGGRRAGGARLDWWVGGPAASPEAE